LAWRDTAKIHSFTSDAYGNDERYHQLTPSLSQLEPNLSQLNPNLSQLKPTLISMMGELKFRVDEIEGRNYIGEFGRDDAVGVWADQG
jgi:hypothetical protein